MATLSVDDMKDRIMQQTRKSQPKAFNAKENSHQTNPTSPPTEMGGSRGQAHGAMESGAMAYQTGASHRQADATTIPSFQALLRGTASYRIPKPSEIFGIQSGRAHPTLPSTTHASLQHLPHPSGLSTIPQLPAGGLLTPASVTRQKEHGRRMRAISRKMNRATLQRRMEANPITPPNPGTSLPDYLPMMDSAMITLDPNTPTLTPSGWIGAIGSGLRSWCTAAGSDGTGLNHEERDVGVHVEFDTDVVDALVYTLGRWMGLNTEQLRDSPGLRTLVSRNIQWFRSSPDWLKLTGLILAKKLNQSLDCPQRTGAELQRLLLERMGTVANGSSQRELDQTVTTTRSDDTGDGAVVVGGGDDVVMTASTTEGMAVSDEVPSPPTPKPRANKRPRTSSKAVTKKTTTTTKSSPKKKRKESGPPPPPPAKKTKKASSDTPGTKPIPKKTKTIPKDPRAKPRPSKVSPKRRSLPSRSSLPPPHPESTPPSEVCTVSLDTDTILPRAAQCVDGSPPTVFLVEETQFSPE